VNATCLFVILAVMLSSACEGSKPKTSVATPTPPSSDAARGEPSRDSVGSEAQSDWRQRWFGSKERVVAAESGSLQVIPFLQDGSGFHYHVVDQSNLFGGLVVEGGENDDPIAITVPPPNWSGRELKIVEIAADATSTIVIAPYQGARDDKHAINKDFALGISQLTASLHCDVDRMAKSLAPAPLGTGAVMIETDCNTKWGKRELVMWAIYAAKARVVIWYSIVGHAGNPRVERARAFGPFTTVRMVQ
jgi:hypothetical protein